MRRRRRERWELPGGGRGRGEEEDAAFFVVDDARPLGARPPELRHWRWRGGGTWEATGLYENGGASLGPLWVPQVFPRSEQVIN